ARLLADAKALEQAGCYSLILEMMPAELSAEIARSVSMPVIGIGAGAGCDGQVLVIYDLLGMNPDFSPKFVKKYLDLGPLIRAAAQRAPTVAVTLFVNPSQFGPAEDLSRYPRDLDGDLRKCADAGATFVFAPRDPAELYPAGFQTWVVPGALAEPLEGEKRPGHFRGVCTVVAKLFALSRADAAFFGEKDFQQLVVIRRMAADLNLGTEVIGRPTVREPDGLAMSSRNAYLSTGERARATALYRAL